MGKNSSVLNTDNINSAYKHSALLYVTAVEGAKALCPNSEAVIAPNCAGVSGWELVLGEGLARDLV